VLHDYQEAANTNSFNQFWTIKEIILTTLVLNVQKDNDNDDVGGRVMTIRTLAI
jgi:hypothetical protein